MPMYPPGLMSVTRRLAQAPILYGVRNKLSANAIQKALQSTGLGYRRTNILADVRYWNDAVARGERMKFTTLANKIGESRYAQTSWRMSSRYETVFEAQTHDPLTGEKYKRYVTVKHTHLEQGIEQSDLTQTKTREELEQEAEDYFEDKSPIPGGEVVDRIMPVMGFYNPRVG